eukprot:Gb_23597 [translate_table: standard]
MPPRLGIEVKLLPQFLLYSSSSTLFRAAICPINPNPFFYDVKLPTFTRGIPILFIQRASVWSMQKDPTLETALARNQRWTFNNQLKNIIIRRPEQAASIQFLQKKAKNLGLKGKVLRWLKKYPCFFEVYNHNFEPWCKLTKRVLLLIEEEETVKQQQEPVLAEKLAKLLMLSSHRKMNVVKFNELRKSFGFPDDYLLSIVAKYPELFRVIDYNGKRSTVAIELVSWNPSLAISTIERRAGVISQGTGQTPVPSFESRLPPSWKKSEEKFMKFKEIPYISPYADGKDLEVGPEESEKRTVGVIHELLSLTLWKRASIAKLGKFKREFRFPDDLVVMLLRHPAIFYVSNKNDIHTVVLRDGYFESELVEKDPLIIMKEKFGELMQDGLHEYNQRRRIANLMKKKANMPLWKMNKELKRMGKEIFEQNDDEKRTEDRYQKEARKRFQKSLSDPDTR